MKKFLVILILGICFFWLIKRKWHNNDFKMGIVTSKQIALLSVSPGRGMINLLTVAPEVDVWLPGGMGWYPSDKVRKIYETDKNLELINKMFFYNFGFVPDKVAFLEDVSEWRNWSLVKYMGPIDWLRYVIEQENWLYKTEVVSRGLDFEKEKIDEILPRDFADNELQSGEIKVSVINSTEENGLGSFVADRLNWMGFSIVAVESEANKSGCETMVGLATNSLTNLYADLMAKMFG